MKSLSIILLLLAVTFCYGDIKEIGNDLVATEGSVAWQGTTFLFNNMPLENGILFAIGAYFVNTNPVHFQIWRPVNLADNRLQLIKSWEIQAANGKTRELVYIHTRQDATCFEVRTGDRLAIYSAFNEGAVGYRFDIVSGGALQHTERDVNTAPQEGDIIQFDSLPFPYTFSVKAYMDTDLSRYPDLNNPACPTDLLVDLDSYAITTPSPVTGAQGATGATGPQGERGTDGATGPVGATGATGPMGIDGATGSTGPQGERGPQGDIGFQGPQGATGQEGPQGATGPAGPPGPVGPSGPVGVSSLSNLDSKYENCDWCWNFLNPYVILAMLVWLIVVTTVIVVIVVVIACKNRRDTLPYTETASTRYGGSNADLWKAYDTVGVNETKVAVYDNEGLEVIPEPYAYVSEGRTEF